MRVSDLMTTALLTANPSDPVSESLLEMKLASIRHLPVVDDNGKLVGIVSDRDVMLALGASEAGNVYLRDIMTRRLETVATDTSAAQALEIMLEKKIGSLPVVGPKGELIGVLTETDFLQVAHRWLLGEQEERGREEDWVP